MEDLLLRGERVVIPASLTSKLIALAHESHPGVVRTKQRLRELCWWTGMDNQVENAVKNCDISQMADKSAKLSTPPLQAVDFPDGRWKKLAVDILGSVERAPATRHQPTAGLPSR